MSDSAVLRFKAKLSQSEAGVKAAAGVVMSLPATVDERLGTLECAEGAVNGHPFRATLERAPSGKRTIRLNQAMLRGAAAGVGDTVTVALLAPEPALTLPADLRVAMNASPQAKALWSDMTDIARRDYVRWVEGTKNPDTRARRIERTIDQLAEGKRRPCCVNTYEYSMLQIDPEYMKKPKRRVV